MTKVHKLISQVIVSEFLRIEFWLLFCHWHQGTWMEPRSLQKYLICMVQRR